MESGTTSAELSDATLVRIQQEHHGKHSAAGNDAFAGLYGRYREPLVQFIQHHHHTTLEEAEDVADEAFAKAYDRLMTISEPEHFRTWLYRVAMNLELGRIRYDHLHAPRCEGTVEHESVSRFSSGPQAALRNEVRRQVADAMAQLSNERREAVQLFYFEELDYEAIAARQSVPIGTVRSRLHGARTTLKGLLEHYVTLGDENS